MKIYLATPIEPAGRSKEEVLNYAEQIARILESQGHFVHRSWNVHIPNAWNLSNYEWGAAVADEDIRAIEDCDLAVGIVYDRREATAGTMWELGYAYGTEKEIWIVEHESVKQMSLMIANCTDTIYKGIENLKNNRKLSYEERTEVC